MLAVEVCSRPPASVAGTRCTRCTPASHLSCLKAPGPSTATLAVRTPPSSDSDRSSASHRHPLASAQAEYMSRSSLAKRDASRPPAPARTSRMAPLFSSFDCCCGKRRSSTSSSNSVTLCCSLACSSLAMTAISTSGLAISSITPFNSLRTSCNACQVSTDPTSWAYSCCTWAMLSCAFCWLPCLTSLAVSELLASPPAIMRFRRSV
mmetsp:Transcript_21131/g.36007  ORF Transcript_21131/g.36007 Transcript_21131/m.36007 type:complete len:207 (-) Transcript_21131:94-714(-)